jgi:hypothetical protein
MTIRTRPLNQTLDGAGKRGRKKDTTEEPPQSTIQMQANPASQTVYGGMWKFLLQDKNRHIAAWGDKRNRCLVS